jgi:hypothetical protein
VAVIFFSPSTLSATRSSLAPDFEDHLVRSDGLWKFSNSCEHGWNFCGAQSLQLVGQEAKEAKLYISIPLRARMEFLRTTLMKLRPQAKCRT